MSILVLGYIIRGPFGGMSWHHLHYILGLKAMGYDVLFLEDSDNYPSCYNPISNEMTADPSYGLNYIRTLFNSYGLQDCWAYYDESTNRWHNYSEQKALAFCAKADIVLNLSVINPLRVWWSKIPVKVFIDTDPVFTQMRLAKSEAAASYANEHTHFFSFGENIGKSTCTIPTAGFPWVATRQPVYLPAWLVSNRSNQGSWTTVMNWDSYAQDTFQGTTFGMKSLSFSSYYDLPLLLPGENFELAIGGPSIPAQKLEAHNWKVVNPLQVTPTPCHFQQYIEMSKGEWTVAKHGYVISNSGWFSERTLNYMATGKPVVIQDTGFSEFLPSGKGLMAFTSPEEAIEGIKEVNADYRLHSGAARKIVEDHFESKLVLSSLLKHLT
jgi:hypothetical protein